MQVNRWHDQSRIQHIAHNSNALYAGANPYGVLSESNAFTGDEAYHSEPQHFGSAFPQGIQPNVQPAVFSSFEPYQLQESEARNLDMLMDIPLQVRLN